jgi:serine/threonine-protein kinase
VIVDVNACAYHIDKDEGGQVVDKIVERVNSE